MNDNILDMYPIPDEAREGLARMGVQSESIGDGVNVISGHEKGVSYRFFIHAEPNPAKSNEAGFEVNDDIEMIEFFVDRKTKPTFDIRFLDPERLTFNRRGEAVGGAYFEDYKRWKEGKSKPGLALDRWDALSPGQVKTLQSEGVYTVEQFAEMERALVFDRFPTEYQDAYDRACLYVGGKDIEARSKEQVEKLMIALEENERLKEENTQFNERLSALESGAKPKRGRPKTKTKKGEGK